MLVRWAPFNEMGRPRAWNPSFEVTEDAAKIQLEADLPGVQQSAVDIQVEHDVLTVKGERKRDERVAGAFERSFRLPPTVEAEKISASMKDGVLTLLLPKKAEAQPRQIKVNVS